MSVFIGKHITVTMYGESHNEYIGAVMVGLNAGIVINYELIDAFLNFRRPKHEHETARVEMDEYKFISGITNGVTNGAPLNIMIRNSKFDSTQYDGDKILRPSTADLTSLEKGNGKADIRGSGHHSARLTAPLCVIGAICYDQLLKKGVSICSHILQIGDIIDTSILSKKNFEDFSENDEYPVFNRSLYRDCVNILTRTLSNCDSIGGKVECGIFNFPKSIGGAYFDGLEGIFSKALFAIPAVKAVEFGLGTDFATANGSIVNDKLEILDGNISYKSNNNGGIIGGISNGEPIVIKVTFKPIPSIRQSQKTVNYTQKINTEITCSHSHDVCALPRAAIIVKSIAAIVCFDLLK